MILPNDFVSVLKKTVPSLEIIAPTSPEALLFLTEKRNNFVSECICVVLPQSTDEVSKIIKLCNHYNISVIPQGGNTGLAGGAVSYPNSIILSTQKLNKIIAIDPSSFSAHVQSGVILHHLQQKLASTDLYFPLSLPSEQFCTIGGNISCNAGGINVLKYGSTKDLILGLKVVLPDGNIFSDLNILRKRNIGPMLNYLFCGSEGILGVITEATLKIFPKVQQKLNILIELDSLEYAKSLFDKLYVAYNSLISSFEIFNNNALNVALLYNPNVFFPLERNKGWYGNISLDIPNIEGMADIIEKDLKNLLTNPHITSYDDKLWEARFSIPNAQKMWGTSLKHDIGLPISHISIATNELISVLESEYPNQLTPIIFGHMGDGNLHFNISSKEKNYDLQKIKPLIKELLIQYVIKYRGTFSAEHGIGLIHKQELYDYYPDTYTMLENLKQFFDKKNILNKNKIIL